MDIIVVEHNDIDNIRSVRPGYGMHPKYINDVLGKISDQDYEFGDRYGI